MRFEKFEKEEVFTFSCENFHHLELFWFGRVKIWMVNLDFGLFGSKSGFGEGSRDRSRVDRGRSRSGSRSDRSKVRKSSKGLKKSDFDIFDIKFHTFFMDFGPF